MLKAILLTDEQISKYGHLMQDVNTLTSASNSADFDNSLSLSYEAFQRDCKNLSKTSAYSFEVDNGGFTARVNRNKESLVFFSVPYEKGWSATVNGSPVTVEKVNNGLMAVLVPKGASTIRFNYTTPGLASGIIISLLSLGIFIIYILASKIYLKNKPCENAYPEGEILLEQWRSDEINDAGMPEKEHRSILDDMDDNAHKPIIPNIENGFDGGFKIDSSFLKDDDK